jgi:hypothetical protein
MSFHGGGTMLNGTVNIYIIWYGPDWSSNKIYSWIDRDVAEEFVILPQFFQDLDNSQYLFLANEYGGAPHIRFVRVITVHGGPTLLSAGTIESVIQGAIQGGWFPVDPNGIYFVFTDSGDHYDGQCGVPGVAECDCGFHDYFFYNGTALRYSWVGDPNGVSTCQTGYSVNGSVRADSMVEITSHELLETITDPQDGGWYHQDTCGEIGDLCNWQWTVQTIGSSQYTVQEQWSNRLGQCLAYGLCPSFQSYCSSASGAYCADLTSNSANCGACGRVCGADQICKATQCVAPTCGGTTPWCDCLQACASAAKCVACNGGGTCFAAGTSITMADGSSRPIESIVTGDRVLSFDETTGAITAGTVAQLLVHDRTPELVRVNGNLLTTGEHRFYTDRSWVRADALHADLSLRTLEGYAPVQSVEVLPGGVTTYNFEVEGTHTYFAGGYLVHNMKAQ